MWFISALLGAIFSSFRKVNEKHLSHTMHHLHLAWLTRVAALPVLGLLAVLSGQFLPGSTLPIVFWVCMGINIFITTPLDTAVYLHSLKHGELSKISPLLSLWPVLMLFSGAIFLQQIPSIEAVIAVLIIATGVYILNTKKGEWAVLKNLWGNRGTRFGLIGIITLAINTTVSAIGIANSSPLFYAFWSCVGLIFVQFVYAQIVAPGKFRNANKMMLAQNGTIQGLAAALQFYAVAVGPVAYVTAIRSLSSTFTAIFGVLAFKEEINRRKALALVLIAVGVVALGLVT